MSASQSNDSSPTMPAPSVYDGGSHANFSSLELSHAREALARLHEQVSFGKGRVEIRSRGSDQVCVMISKSELEALEKALAILANTPEYKSMCESVSEVAAAAGGYARA